MASLANLQVAQILADLNSLQNTVCPVPPLAKSASLPPCQDPKAALDLLNANKALDQNGRIQGNTLTPPCDDVSGRHMGSTPKLRRDNSSLSFKSASESSFKSGSTPYDVIANIATLLAA